MVNEKYFLIVEDSTDISQLLKEFFESEGLSVQTASNGQEALTFLKSTKVLPTFILLDLMMPVMDGFVFRENQQKDPKISQIPIVVMTADSQIEAKTIKVNANGYVKKPIDNLDELLNTVKQFHK